MATAIETPTNTVDEIAEFGCSLDEVAGHLNAQHARLVDLTIRLLADEQLWLDEGLHTPELFLAWRIGLAPQRARQIVAIARRADELPVSLDAFRRGELAVDQMAAIANRAPWWTDAEVSDLAKHLTVGQLHRTLATYPFPDIAPPDAGTPDPAPAPDVGSDPHVAASTACCASEPDPTPASRMWWGVGDDGRFRLHAECDAITGLIIGAALDDTRNALFNSGQTDIDDIEPLVALAQQSLATISEPARRERARTYIHLRTDGTATDAHGATLPDAIRQYVTCDGLLSPVFVHAGIPISVGRTQRTIPLRTRRLVLLRDHGCAIPGCNQTEHLDIHHIVHWEHDGPTETWNLIALCPRHHRLHHRGDINISGNADDPGGVTITNRHGRPLATTGARPQPPGAPPTPPASRYQHPLGERLDHKWLYFNPPAEHRHTAWANHPHNPHNAN